MSSIQNIFFVGVACRVNSEGIVVGSFSFKTKTDLGAVKQVLEQPTVNLVPGKHYAIAVGQMAWHLIQDELSLIYILICKQSYPLRCAHACLEELKTQFCSKVDGHKATTAKDSTFDRPCAALFEKICLKYDNLAEVDKLAALAMKVDSVKLTMQDNIDRALQNCITLESLEQAAEELQVGAGVFRTRTLELKNKMWWKNMKIWIIIGVIILVILGIIIGVAVAFSEKK